jgi:putative glutamyl-tRNA(gln) amidotransferase subunit C
MEFFETNDELTRLDVKKSRARDLITYLLENNFISKIGKYKSTKYIKNQSKVINL